MTIFGKNKSIFPDSINIVFHEISYFPFGPCPCNSGSIHFLEFIVIIILLNCIYRIVSPSEIGQNKESTQVPRKASVWMDDGFASQLYAARFLNYFGIPVAIAISSEFIEKKYFWRATLNKHAKLVSRMMQRDGLSCSEKTIKKASKSLNNTSDFLQSVYKICCELSLMQREMHHPIAIRHLKQNPSLFCNHTASHQLMSSLTLDQQKNEIKKCQAFLYSNDIRTDELVIPFGDIGSWNSDTICAGHQCGTKRIWVTNCTLDEIDSLELPIDHAMLIYRRVCVDFSLLSLFQKSIKKLFRVCWSISLSLLKWGNRVLAVWQTGR